MKRRRSLSERFTRGSIPAPEPGCCGPSWKRWRSGSCLSLVAVSASDAKINTTAPLDQTLPSVAMDANGDYVVAWNNQVHLGPNYLYDVEARVYNSAGQAQTGEIVVAQTTGDTRPSVAMDANGDFVVAWQVLNTSTYLYGDLRPAVQPRRDGPRKYSDHQRRELARVPRASCPKSRWTPPATS